MTYQENTLRPDTPAGGYPDWTVTGAGSQWQALGAGLGAYVDNPGVRRTTAVQLDQFTLPAGERVRGISLRVRLEARNMTSPSYVEAQLRGWGGAPHRLYQHAAANKSTYIWQTPFLPVNGFGREFTQRMINDLSVHLRESDEANRWRVYEVYAVVQRDRRPVASNAAVTGQTVTAQPTVTFDFTDADDDPQDAARVAVFAEDVYTAPGFDPETSTEAVWDSGEVAGSVRSVQIGVPLDAGRSYRAVVWVAQAMPAALGGRWWSEPDTVDFSLSFTPPVPPQVVREVQADRARVLLDVVQRANLLSRDTASMETAATDWLGNDTRCTVSRSTGDAFEGSASLLLTANTTSGAGMNAWTDPIGARSDWRRIRPGETYSIVAFFKAPTGTDAGRVRVRADWYDQVGSYLSTDGSAPFSWASVEGWTVAFGEFTAPADAADAGVDVQFVDGISSGDELRVDAVSMFAGPLPENLLSADNSSFSGGNLGDWAAVSNATVSWIAGPSLEGAGAMLVESAGAGDAEVQMGGFADGIDVVGGEVLTIRGGVQPVSGAAEREVDFGMRWYYADGSSVSIEFPNTVQSDFGRWVGPTDSVDAPVGAVKGVPYILVNNCAAAGEQFRVDAIYVWRGSAADAAGYGPGAADSDPGELTLRVQAQRARGKNLLPDALSRGATIDYPLVYSGELDRLELSGLDARQGEETIRWNQGTSALSLYGSGPFLDFGAPSVLDEVQRAPIAPAGRDVLFSCWVRTVSGSATVRAHVDALASSGYKVATVQGSSTTVDATGWTRVSSTRLTVPDGAVNLRARLELVSGGPADLLVDELMVEETDTDVPGEWVRGTGDRGPTTWEDVRATGADGQDTQEVADLRHLVYDYEAPYGQGAALYRVRTEQVVEGVPVASSWVQVAAFQERTPGFQSWLKDVEQPARNVLAHVTAVESQQAAEDVELVDVLGSGLPVAVSFGDVGGEDGTLVVHVQGNDAWLKLRDVVMAGRPLLVQSPGGLDQYVRLSARSWPRQAAVGGLVRTVQLPFREVAAP